VPASALASKLSAIASAQQGVPSPAPPSAPNSKAPSTHLVELVACVHLCISGNATVQGNKRKAPSRAATKSAVSPKRKSLYSGWTVQGSGTAREIPWVPVHEAFDKVQLTPPTSGKAASPRVMQKGDTVQIKGDLERWYSVYWLQARNIEPTGWECAVGCGSNSAIIPLSEIVAHTTTEPRDVNAAASAYWNEKSMTYAAFQEQDAELECSRDKAAHSMSKRHKAVRTAQSSMAIKPGHGTSRSDTKHQ
jgi:hypothetical protein